MYNNITSLTYIAEDNITPFTSYICNLTASTSVGEGPQTSIKVTTEESGKK